MISFTDENEMINGFMGIIDEDEHGSGKLPNILSPAEMRDKSLEVAGKIGDNTYRYLCRMREGNDPFANKQLTRILGFIYDAMLKKMASVRVKFELDKNYRPQPIAQISSSSHSSNKIIVHEQIFMDDPDNLYMFENLSDIVSYYNALTEFILTSFLDAGYVITSRPLPSPNKGTSAPYMPRNNIHKFKSRYDVAEDFMEHYPIPNLEYGREGEIFIYWGDPEFHERLDFVSSSEQSSAIVERKIPIDDIIKLPKSTMGKYALLLDQKNIAK